MTNVNEINITNEELPNVIETQYNSIIDIDLQIKKAEELCLEAQTKINDFNSKKAKTSEVIMSTQNAVKYLSDAQISLAESQKLLFLNQQKMVDGMKYLLLLGSSSIAMNKTVIEQLEAKLKQASFEKMSVNSKNELLGVIRLLKEQENSLITSQRMNAQLLEAKKKILEHEQEINTIHFTDDKQDKKDKEHDILLEESLRKDKEHDLLLEERANKDLMHDKAINEIKLIAYIGFGIAVIAFVLAIIAMFK